METTTTQTPNEAEYASKLKEAIKVERAKVELMEDLPPAKDIETLDKDQPESTTNNSEEEEVSIERVIKDEEEVEMPDGHAQIHEGQSIADCPYMQIQEKQRKAGCGEEQKEDNKPKREEEYYGGGGGCPFMMSGRSLFDGW